MCGYLFKLYNKKCVGYIAALRGHNYFFFWGLEKNVLFDLDLEQSPTVDSEGIFLVDGKPDQQKHGVMSMEDSFQE